MRGFESDCGDGKGNAVACHQVGEFLSVVKNDFKRAGKIFGMNCEDRGHGPSCFNLGRFLCEATYHDMTLTSQNYAMKVLRRHTSNM